MKAAIIRKHLVSVNVGYLKDLNERWCPATLVAGVHYFSIHEY